MLNLLGKQNISKEYFNHIVELFQRCSKGPSKTNIHNQGVFTRAQKSADGGATWDEIGNLLEYFKTFMMISISSQLDILRAKQK